MKLLCRWLALGWAAAWLTRAEETLAPQADRAIHDGVLSGEPLTLPPLSVYVLVTEP